MDISTSKTEIITLWNLGLLIRNRIDFLKKCVLFSWFHICYVNHVSRALLTCVNDCKMGLTCVFIFSMERSNFDQFKWYGKKDEGEEEVSGLLFCSENI